MAKARQALRDRRNEHRTRKMEAQKGASEMTFERAPVASVATPLLPNDAEDEVLAARRAKLGISDGGSERDSHGRGDSRGRGCGRGRGGGRAGRRRRGRYDDDEADDSDDDGPATLTLDEYNAMVATESARPEAAGAAHGTLQGSAPLAPAPDAEQVRTLTSMGFSQAAVMAALQVSGNCVEAALDHLLAGSFASEATPGPDINDGRSHAADRPLAREATSHAASSSNRAELPARGQRGSHAGRGKDSHDYDQREGEGKRRTDRLHDFMFAVRNDGGLGAITKELVMCPLFFSSRI